MLAPMSTAFRSHTCGELRAEHVGKRVTLAGWVHRRRDHGHLAFFDLRDRHGITQVVTSAEEGPEAHQAAEPARNEWVVQVEGTVRHRPDGTTNAELATGEIEVAVDRFEVLNPSKVPPFYINEEQPGLDESLRLKHRYLDLRRPPMQQRMLLRSRLASSIRGALEDEGFVEIETPTLIKSTPEGARDFIVPSRLRPGEFFALPQSPQQLKQLLMVAGYDRYYQLAHAYRDEDLRGDRQPEHTQVDIEMSFVSEEDVISTVERVVTRVAKEVLPDRPLLNEPFPRLTFAEAMDRYGSDKPDIRFGMELTDLTDAVRDVDFRVFAEPIAAGGAVFGILAPGVRRLLAQAARRADRSREAPRRQGPRPPVGPGGRVAPWAGREVPRGTRDLPAGGHRCRTRRPRPHRRRCRPHRRRRGDRPRPPRDGRSAWPAAARRPLVRLGPSLPDVHVGCRRPTLGRDPQPVQRAGS